VRRHGFTTCFGKRLAIFSLGVVCFGAVVRGDEQPQVGPPAIPTQERLALGSPKPVATGVAEPVKTPATLAGSSLQVALALTAVVGVIVLVGVVVRKVASRGGGLFAAIGPGGRAPSGVLEVLGRFPLGRGGTLVLLKLDRRVLLISMGVGRLGGGMNTLCEITDPEEVASLLLRTRDEAGESIAKQFAGLLQREDEHANRALKVAATPVTTGTKRPVTRPGRPTLEVRA
jgi:flagellar biogenesis protein FliO